MTDQRNNAVGPQTRTVKKGPGLTMPLLTVGTLTGALAASTQFFAYSFQYHQLLGPNVGNIYAPWSIIGWAAKWHSVYPNAITGAGGIGVTVASSGLMALLFAQAALSNRSKPNAYLHGSARWADPKDIRDAGLLPRPMSLTDRLMGRKRSDAHSVFVGGWIDKQGNFHYLRHSGPEHVLCYAPTRSGKGVGLVVPTLLSWGASTFVTDLKGELWALTAGWRQKHAGNKVLRFEPASGEGSARWNPLDEIRVGTEYEVGDVQNLANLVVDPDGKGLEGEGSHWKKTAYALLTGVFLHAIYKARDEGKTATLSGIDRMLSDPNRPCAELWMEMATYPHSEGKNHPLIGSAARDMMDRPDDEAGSVLSTAKSDLSLYRDPVIARNTSCSDFSIRDLMHADCPVSLYTVTQPNDKGRLKPLVRILVNMVFRLLADKMDFEKGRPVAHYKHRLLFMGDEFPSLGKLEIVQESLAFVAGYGIKCYLIAQDLNQLKSEKNGYGKDEAITSNCHIQNAYPPNRIETAEHLSKLTGETTVVEEKVTHSGKRMSPMLGQVSRTTQETKRRLLTPDECQRMPGPTKGQAHGKDVIVEGGDMIIYVAGYPAIYGKQPLYFKDPVFQARAEIPAPAVSDRLKTAEHKPQQIVSI